jgi:biotin synthase-related radical SAM superfamily protein
VKVEVSNRNVPKVNVSIGTAAVLGLARVPMAVAPTTAYLMLGGRCLMNCTFCAQARESQANALHLSRVTWPEYDLAAVVEKLAGAVARDDIRRACLQVTVTADAFEQALAILHAVKADCEVPFDVAILPRDLDQVRRLVMAGADHIGFGAGFSTGEGRQLGAQSGPHRGDSFCFSRSCSSTSHRRAG